MRIISDNLGIGKNLYFDKKYVDALAFFYRALAMSELTEDLENQVISREYIARSYYQMNRFKESLRQLEMLKSYPMSTEKQIRMITLRAICLNLSSRFDEAINQLHQLADYDLEIAHRKMHINLGVVLYRLHKYRQVPTLNQALEHFNHALQYSLDDVLANKLYRNIGISLSEQGNFKEALQMFDKSLSYIDDPKETHYTKIDLAFTYSKVDRYDEAESLLTEAITYLDTIDDNYGVGHALLARGFNFFRMSDTDKAEDCVYDAIHNFLKTECFVEVSDCYNLLSTEFAELDTVKAKIYARELKLYCAKIG